MAVIRGGSPLGELSGKMGGLVFARNRGGAYVRSYAVPVNPNTVAQVTARSQFGAAAANWHALTAGEKAQWENYAEQIFQPLVNANGASFSGHNAFVSLTNVCANANLKALSTANTFIYADDEITNWDITGEALYGVVINPPSQFNTGKLLVETSAGGISAASLEVVSVSLEVTGGAVNLTARLKPIISGQSVVGPVSPTTEFTIVDGFQNSIANKVGFAFYMSESVNQQGDFIVNPFKIHLGTTLPIISTETALNFETFRIESGVPININNYQQIPSPGDIVRITVVMVDQFGQRKLIGAETTTVSTTP